MLAQSLRVVSRATIPAMRRNFTVSAARRDIIQDLYLKELKAYKVPVVKASDSVGQVKPWEIPAAPKAPTLEAGTAADLAEYESQVVEVEGVSAAVEEEPEVEDWFVVEPIKDQH
ncbi:ATP synthase complex subunit H-domain-containing protein [Lipomyces japonicus]|uniref:ATP synthase complex subunit H-domain-containing protein n=1 Tax=Lipomyces japonicus TaxID=56871 RepID=UPI0034CD4575